MRLPKRLPKTGAAVEASTKSSSVWRQMCQAGYSTRPSSACRRKNKRTGLGSTPTFKHNVISEPEPEGSSSLILWCPRWESNPHVSRQRFLRPPRLPFRHTGNTSQQTALSSTTKASLVVPPAPLLLLFPKKSLASLSVLFGGPILNLHLVDAVGAFEHLSSVK